jgi:hypothetical protein
MHNEHKGGKCYLYILFSCGSEIVIIILDNAIFLKCGK